MLTGTKVTAVVVFSQKGGVLEHRSASVALFRVNMFVSVS